MNLLRIKLILFSSLMAGILLRGQMSAAEILGVEAAFDPPVVPVEGKSFYRVTVAAPAASIQWPDRFHTPITLKLEGNTRGEILGNVNGQMMTQTTFLFETLALMTGNLTIPPFVIGVDGRRVVVPAATLTVVEDNSITSLPPRRILLEIPKTNFYVGESFVARLLLPVGPANQIDALREVQFNGDGFIAGKTALRMSVETVERAGRKGAAYLQEMLLTPLAVGDLKLSAQGFTAGREFTGAITITGGANGPVILGGGPVRYVLLTSETVPIKVRPLPEEGRRPGFTGGIGKFTCGPPQLSTNRVCVGEPLLLKVTLHGENAAVKLNPPFPPQLKDWEIIPEHQSGIGFTLIPLTDELRATPAIPFSCFDPETGEYVDLTIPPVPVTIISGGLSAALPPVDNESGPAALKLTGLAPRPGITVSSLKPLQLRPWFVSLQMLPVIGFLGLWQWDRRRRFLEAHPEIVLRRQAIRALRPVKVKLRKTAAAGDAAAFVRHAAAAMRIACAPHFPAHPRALVCADVLAVLAGQEGAGETVRRIFGADDARFAAAPEACAGLLALRNDVDAVLQILEEQL
ncbi:MAG: BatD family protein [Verrucomicrobiota bacterium]